MVVMIAVLDYTLSKIDSMAVEMITTLPTTVDYDVICTQIRFREGDSIWRERSD